MVVCSVSTDVHDRRIEYMEVVVNLLVLLVLLGDVLLFELYVRASRT